MLTACRWKKGETCSLDFAALTSSAFEPAFWTPERLGRQSSWWGHVPFAFWLVANSKPRLLVELGTHHGVSYAAFCEAVLRLRLETRCYAVDAWAGDPHAGAYAEDVYAELKHFHDERYVSFSQLVRSTFDEACSDYADGTIDLLHIDGYHTYEAVRHDFENWRAKLSDRAVVLFHDTNERQRDFGVWRFLAELKQVVPVFEFLHAHGLGVAAVGANAPDVARWLCGLRDEAVITSVRNRFSILGTRWMVEQERSNLEQEQSNIVGHAHALENLIVQKDGQLVDDQKQMADLQSVLANTQQQNVELSDRVQRLEQDLNEAEKQRSILRSEVSRNNDDLVRRLAALTRNDYHDRLPRYLKGWRWVPLGRQKKWRRLVRDYRLIARSSLFDREWYLQRNPDVALQSDDPVLHYVLYGGRERRSPGPDFDADNYLKANPDVAALGMNPLLHYLLQGHKENRRLTSAEFRRAPATLRSDRFPEGLPKGVSLEMLTVPLPYGKALYMKRCELVVFRVRNAGPICFPPPEQPFFSVIIPAFNKFMYNIRVLELLEHAVCYTKARNGLGIEVIFIDDNSTDETSRLQDYVKGIVFRRVSSNMGFLRACNFGASLATGAYLVFLNNDVEFGPDTFVRLHDAIERDKAEVACFGGEILQFDGSIQDLGSGIWRDGVAMGYFRDESPMRYAYAYPRDVDYVAGCFFCISAAEFREFKGFDEVFAPGYYEETDLSMRLWEAGRCSRVYPDIRLYHLEYGSFSSVAPRASIELMAKNRPIFAQRHQELLNQRPEFKPNAGYPVRYNGSRPRILFIEDRVPSMLLGTGYGRSEIIIRALLKKADIDIFSFSPQDDDPIPEDFGYIEITYGPDVSILEDRLASRHYDAVYVCRPHNIAAYGQALRAWRRGGGCIVYDAEAIFAVREVARTEHVETYSEITGKSSVVQILDMELRPAELADVVVAVSEKEAAILRRRLNKPVLTIGHYLAPNPLGIAANERSGLLFVGALRNSEPLNYDSLLWFLDHVWPRIRAVRPEETLRIAGYVRPEAPLGPLQRDGVTCLGPVTDLTTEYARARVFIAPTRFAAGIPFKVHEALSYGLPVVSSRLIADQLANDGEIVSGVSSATVKDGGQEFTDACVQLLSDDALWSEQQEAALAHVKAFCPRTALVPAIDALLGELRERPAEVRALGLGPFSHVQKRLIDLEDWRAEIALADKASVVLKRPIGIFVHLYYDDLVEEVAGTLARIDVPKRIYVSTNSEEKSRRIADALDRFGLNSCSEIAIVPNCGFDIAPMLIQFREKIASHEICLKIHGKKSASERVEFGERWRKFLYQDLVGDSAWARAIVGVMLETPDLGVLMAQHFYGVDSLINIGPNYESMRNVLSRIGIDLRSDQKIEFPSGSMFWFRSAALADLFALGLDWSDFEVLDSRKKDGSLAHGIERCFLFFCAASGKRWGFLPPYRSGPKVSRDEVVRLIRASGAFDDKYYRANYADVREAGVDPVEHWVDFGAREARNPSDPRLPNPEIYRLLDCYLRGQPLTTTGTTAETVDQQRTPKTLKRHRGAGDQTRSSGSLEFSALEPGGPSTHYHELAPAVSSLPVAPSFVLGPFPDFLTHTYFGDVTALSVGSYTLNNVGVTSHGLLVRDGVLLTSHLLSLSKESITEAAGYGNLYTRAEEYSRVIDEPIVSLAGPGHLIFGHWLVDFLPKLYLLRQSGIDPRAAKYLLPANTPHFALSWLQLLGITTQQLVFFEPYDEVVGATHLIVPTLLRTNGRTHPLFRPAIEYLTSLLPSKRERGSEPGTVKRLYLSRGVAGPENRKLLNRQAIERLAAKAGYKVVRPETLSITDQLRMFAGSKTIVGEYGSALHGSLFAPPGAMVCALRASARHPGFLQSGLCQAMGQKIGYVFGPAAEHDVEQEFTIREDDFKTALGLIDMC